MNKEEICSLVAQDMEMDSRIVNEVVRVFISKTAQVLSDGHSVCLKGLVTFMPIECKERKGFNPYKRESMMIPGTRRISAKVSNSIQSLLRKNSSVTVKFNSAQNGGIMPS